MKILKNQISEAEYVRMTWAIKPEHGATLADVVAPEYWSHVSQMIKPGALIQVMPVDNTWWAELIVRGVRERAVDVHVLRSVVFDQEQKPQVVGEVAPYVAKFAGPHAKWRVIRASDNEVVKEGLEKNEALDWIEAQKVAA